MVLIGVPIKKLKENLDYANPSSEDYLENIKIECTRAELPEKMIFDDKTINYVKNDYTKEQMIQALVEIIKSLYGENQDKVKKIYNYFLETLNNNPSRQKYFENRGLTKVEAYCSALALSFYTGKNGTDESDEINRRASAVCRFGNDYLTETTIIMERSFSVIFYYILRALSCIPFFWGFCIRAAELDQITIDSYQVGSVISWIQFSSTTSGTNPPDHFKKRNTYFYIFSFTGRKIREFSNFPTEDEVLFSPYSNFLVCKKILENQKNKIYLRQIELGFQEKIVFWVDDQILNEKWENKSIMELITSQGLHQNVSVIAKTNTESALKFLNSQIGKNQISISNKNLIFITDMYRKNEVNPSEAGARFVKILRKLGFSQNIMIYTSNKKTSTILIEKFIIEDKDKKNIFITQTQSEALKFIKNNLGY
jgi:NAD:arginine ADP-ribosyltransferase